MTYSLQFTERMIGAFSFGEDNYEAGFRSGRPDANGILFRLTIGTADVSAFIADPRHEAVPTGYVKCESLGGTLPVLDGAFNLFVDEGGAVRHMLYRLYFADATGRPLTLAGFKNVNPGPITRVWPETSTLYTAHPQWPHSCLRRWGKSERWDRRVGDTPHPAPRLRRSAHHVQGPRADVVWTGSSSRRLRHVVHVGAMAGVQSAPGEGPTWLTSDS